MHKIRFTGKLVPSSRPYESWKYLYFYSYDDGAPGVVLHAQNMNHTSFFNAKSEVLKDLLEWS